MEKCAVFSALFARRVRLVSLRITKGRAVRARGRESSMRKTLDNSKVKHHFEAFFLFSAAVLYFALNRLGYFSITVQKKIAPCKWQHKQTNFVWPRNFNPVESTPGSKALQTTRRPSSVQTPRGEKTP